ncbi:MAG: [LysW]-aminoadipate/[LysW]-glutamate kinase [Conexivisphaerales archaeon]
MSKISVIKVGGSLISESTYSNVIKDLKESGMADFILVHGGGNEVTKYSKALGKDVVFVTSPEGIRSRYTDMETVAIYNMVMRKIASELVLFLNAQGFRAIGLSGIDASLIKAERKKKLIIIDELGRKRAIDGGYTGRVKEVDSGLLLKIVGLGVTPVISPVALSYDGEMLNIDGDRAASAVASALHAQRLIIFTNVDGVIINGKVKERMSLKEAREALKKVGPGMDKKLIACIEAIEGGAREGIIANGKVERPVNNAINGLRTIVEGQ